MIVTLLKHTLELAGFMCGVTAAVLLLYAVLGLAIYGRDPLTPRLFVGATVFGLAFLLVAGIRIWIG